MNIESHHHVYRTLIEHLATLTHLKPEEIVGQLRPPPKAGMGDYAFPCFSLAKQQKKAPPELARELEQKLILDGRIGDIFSKIEAAGPFLNFTAHHGVLSSAILRRIFDQHHLVKHKDAGQHKTIVIDYSSPNFAKPFHIGHLMSTILGASLVRIFRAQGYTVEGVNHLGDWGTQCGYQFLAWQRSDPKARDEQLQNRGLDFLVDLYVEINKPAKRFNELKRMLLDQNICVQPEERSQVEAELEELQPVVDEIENEARALFKKLEEGDPELKALWQRMRTTTMAVLQKAYDRLGVKFESDVGEAFYEPYLKPMVEDLKQKGVLEKSEGAWVIPLTEPGAKKKKPPFIVVKSDGATKYETRDLAAAIYRKEHYDFAQNLYVVNVQQKAHFEGLFKALSKAGYEWSCDCHHISFGIMKVKEGDEVLPMSTRSGRMIPLTDLLDGMVKVVRGIIEEKNPELPEERKAEVAEAVGVGAVLFWVQSRRRESNIVFDWKLATNPEGDTGPYVQYTHARACAILRKFGGEIPLQADLERLEQPEETAVCKNLDRFPDVLEQAARNYEPSILATWLIETARSFNDFYNKCPVLKVNDSLRDARLALVEATRQVLVEGLHLLGLSAPEEM